MGKRSLQVICQTGRSSKDASVERCQVKTCTCMIQSTLIILIYLHHAEMVTMNNQKHKRKSEYCSWMRFINAQVYIHINKYPEYRVWGTIMLQLSSIKGRITMVHKLYAYYTCACTTLSSSSCFFEAKLVLDVYISDDGRITSLNGSLLSLHLGEREGLTLCRCMNITLMCLVNFIGLT